MTQDASPSSFVVAVHDSEPLRVKVTGSLPTGAPVVESVRVPETGVGEEKSPVTGLMVRVVGDVVGAVGCVAAVSMSSTERPKRTPELVEMVCRTAPVSRSICQISPVFWSAVQKDVPLGSTAMANRP